MSLSKKEKEELFNEFKKNLFEPKKIYIETCRDNIELSKYANIGDAGMDIKAAEDIDILPGETKIIPTGLKMVIPDGYEIQIRPRSGITLRTPLRIPNSPGTIDSGYRDELGVMMENTSTSNNGDYSINDKGNKQGKYTIKKGDRIAQMVLVRFETINFEITTNIELYGTNRGGGFGSTGTE